MYIKEFVKFELNINYYYPLYSQNLLHISYVASFFYDGFFSLKRDGISNSIQKLELFFQDDVVFGYNLCDITIDHAANIVYFSENYYDYRNKPTTIEIENLLTDGKWIELCKMNFLKYTTMSENNFYYLILAWDAILDKLPSCILLYLNDNDWYDVLPFNSQEAMEKFIADHTKVENLEK